MSKHIVTGLMAELKSGETVRIVSVDDDGVKVEADHGIFYVRESMVNRTYSPCEAVGQGKPFVETSGIELGE